MKTDEELKKESPELYEIARKGGTEMPFKGKYVNTKDAGTYHCAVCDTPLFSSSTKFDSKTGWPSFTDPANKEAVTFHEDDNHGMRRTEVRCKNCGAHLGHVFPDLPASRPNVYFVYAILCDNDDIYIGHTKDLRKRWMEHVSGTASDHTKKHKPMKVIHFEEYGSRSEAVKREKELKTGFGRKWLKREWKTGRTRQAGGPEKEEMYATDIVLTVSR